MANVTIKWYGEEIIDDVKASLRGGVDASIKQIYKDSQANCPVNTGRLKRSGKILPAEDGEDDIYGRVIYEALYAIYPELDQKYLRRALMENEDTSERNFEGALK